jgi:hypothetical protein
MLYSHATKSVVQMLCHRSYCMFHVQAVNIPAV